MLVLPGVSGTLVPSAYLASRFAADARDLGLGPISDAAIRTVRATWTGAEARCGPATGLRALYDLVAEPLFESLGYRTRALSFSRLHATATLVTPGHATVALLLLPWASAPSSASRDAFLAARQNGAAWTFVFAPPFLSLVLVSSTAARRRLDFALPAVLACGTTHPFWTLTSARTFDAPLPGDEAGAPVILRVLDRASLFQDRVRDDLQSGVVSALGAISGLVPAHPALTIVYRILFLLFAESRHLVPVGHPIYRQSYSMAGLADDARRGVVTGAWDGLGAMTRLARAGCRSSILMVAPFGGRLFARASAAELESTPSRASGRRKGPERDAALGRALVALASRQGRDGREPISYRDLGVEELGAVYERLLDLPALSSRPSGDPPVGERTRSAQTVEHRRERKLSGTFYTPRPLAEFIVRRTLAPLVRGASSDAILALRVVDPAMGSGACLIAACRYLSAAYEDALVEEGRASTADLGDRERAEIRRLISGRCLAGVDRNPTAVELARLSLWLATLAEGRPLGFLDHRLRLGDSLVGAWPHDLGHLSMAAARGASTAPLPLFDHAIVDDALARVGPSFSRLLEARDDSIGDVRAKEVLWQRLVSNRSPLEPWRQALSFWCARWFWPGGSADRPSSAEARSIVDALIGTDRTLPPGRVAARVSRALETARLQHFFHWPLEFPDVFARSSSAPGRPVGFDAVIGNPPWEMLRRGDGRASHDARDLLAYVRESRQFPSCQQGHLNLYQAFLDRAFALTRPGGRIGLVLPWGLAADDGAAALRRRLFDESRVSSIVGLDNAGGLFPIHRGIRFLVVSTTPGRSTTEARARFGVTTREELESLPEADDPLAPAYPVGLTRRRLEAVSGPSLRIPDVRDARDADLAAALAARFPRLGDPNGWHLAFGREANATEARPWLCDRGLPVLEGKHVSPFAIHTAGTSRIERTAAEALIGGGRFDRSRLAYRDVSGVGNALTLIAAVIPPGMVTSHTLLCLKTPVPLDRQHFLAALFNSWVMNAVVRLLMSNHVTTTLVESLAMPLWTGDRRDRWIAAVARTLAERRDAELHARLQAVVATRCGLSPAAFSRVLDTFPLVAASVRNEARRQFAAANGEGPG